MSNNGTKKGVDNVITLSTGLKVKVSPVPDFLMSQSGRHLTEPKAPFIEDSRYKDGRKFFNEDDPEFQEKARQFNHDLGMARIDTKLLWGCEIIEGYPEDDQWLRKLHFQEQLGAIGLAQYNLEEDFVRRFLYLKLFGIGSVLDDDGANADLNNILNALDISDAGVNEAIDTFPDLPQGDTDKQSKAKEPS